MMYSEEEITQKMVIQEQIDLLRDQSKINIRRIQNHYDAISTLKKEEIKINKQLQALQEKYFSIKPSINS